MSANAVSKKHALGSRASKSHLGILTVRFEMPFPIWCTTCPKPTIIGQGVRFNAEKKKVDTYYSTPIYSFRMKHPACGGWIEIRTDPKNTAYIVTEGARKRDLGEDVVKDGDYEIMTAEEREKLRENAFSNLEYKKAEVERAKGAKERIEDLQAVQDDLWEDPYEQNKRLRAAFREGRHQREKDAQVTGLLQDKMSLGIELLPPSKEDDLRAGLIEFGVEADANAVLKQPIFESGAVKTTRSGLPTSEKVRGSKRLKAEVKADKARETFAANIRGNTRAKFDPFLSSSTLLGKPYFGVKRKRDDNSAKPPDEQRISSEPPVQEESEKFVKPKMALVDYGSDSE